MSPFQSPLGIKVIQFVNRFCRVDKITQFCPFAASEPVSARLLVNMETVAVGMTVAVLVFPLQCFLCFLFRKAHSQVTF